MSRTVAHPAHTLRAARSCACRGPARRPSALARPSRPSHGPRGVGRRQLADRQDRHALPHRTLPAAAAPHAACGCLVPPRLTGPPLLAPPPHPHPPARQAELQAALALSVELSAQTELQRLKLKVPEEPAADAPADSVASCMFRLPNGSRLSRRFALSATLEQVRSRGWPCVSALRVAASPASSVPHRGRRGVPMSHTARTCSWRAHTAARPVSRSPFLSLTPAAARTDTHARAHTCTRHCHTRRSSVPTCK